MPVNIESTNYHRAVCNKISKRQKKQYFYSMNKQYDQLPINESMIQSMYQQINESIDQNINESITNQRMNVSMNK